MSRPGAPLTRKDLLLQTKLADLEKGDKQGNALLAALDMENELIPGDKKPVDDVVGQQPKSRQASKYAAWLDSDKWNFPFKVKFVFT